MRNEAWFREFERREAAHEERLDQIREDIRKRNLQIIETGWRFGEGLTWFSRACCLICAKGR